MMAKIESHEKKPVPGVDHSIIQIPDDNNLGTGTFITMLEPNALAKINPIISSIQNEPVFQLIVSINLAIESVTAMIGKADDTPPLSRKVFSLPKEIVVKDAHRFDAAFKDWQIEEMSMDGVKLELSA
jgi:hypothetical protein